MSNMMELKMIIGMGGQGPSQTGPHPEPLAQPAGRNSTRKGSHAALLRLNRDSNSFPVIFYDFES